MIEKQLTLKHYLALALIVLVVAIASIHPLEFESYLLHQAGTLFMLIALLIAFKKIGLNYLSFCLYLAFLFIHIIGAHYLYSYVPYNQWILYFFNFDLNQSMGWSRNMYDRLVHFAYGLLLYPFIYRCFQVWLPNTKPFSLFLLVIQFVMASSVFYELLEWGLSIGLSPEDAENYNGQQGDMWDAHKDMFLATIGAILTGIIQLVKQKTLIEK
ncbi:inner membrane protein YjdF [Acinetobacter calcoaceticus]